MAMAVRRLPGNRERRGCLNQEKGIIDGVGEFGIPELWPEYDVAGVEKWISFNEVGGCSIPERTGVHFFVEDHLFERVWSRPERYYGVLAKFGAVCTPDFSPFSDFPKACQVWNHYRKHWCGWWWQRNGVKVVPTVTWSSPETLEWAFDGEPVGGVVAISSVGMFDTVEHERWLVDGYEEMVRRLKPVKVLWKGKVPERYVGDGRIQRIEASHLERLHGLRVKEVR